LTFSVTYRCQSRCQTCNIWQLQQRGPEGWEEELTLWEIEKIFQGMKSLYFFNLSGGCPFLRDDLPQIIELACRYLRPRVIHIPTNGLSPDRVLAQTRRILRIIERRDRKISLQIKASLDGIGPEQDRIRGVEGNFARLEYLLRELKRLKRSHPQLHLGLGTVISTLNLDSLPEIWTYVEEKGVDSYIVEVAGIRAELFNKDMDLTPSASQYRKILPLLLEIVQKGRRQRDRLTRMVQAFRTIYYRLVAQILEGGKEILPCYAGISNVHLNPYGELWPCCVLGHDSSLGNLRESGYDFYHLWHSDRAREVRRVIKERRCCCPLANQAYANILCNMGKSLQAALLFLSPR